MMTEPYTPESNDAHCPVCGEVAEWVDCPVCTKPVEATVHVERDVKPETVQALGKMMKLVQKQFCEHCAGDGGWYVCPLGCEVKR